MDFINFQEDVGAITTFVQSVEPDWGLRIFLLGIISLVITIPIAVRLRGPVSALESHKPINHAYEWLSRNRFYEDENHEEEEIAHSLEQAALDEKITIWGGQPNAPFFEEEKPVRQKISPDYWVKYQINRNRLYRSADKFPDEGHVTHRRSSFPPEPDEQIYWHLRVDMNEIKARWKSPTKGKWL